MVPEAEMVDLALMALLNTAVPEWDETPETMRF